MEKSWARDDSKPWSCSHSGLLQEGMELPCGLRPLSGELSGHVHHSVRKLSRDTKILDLGREVQERALGRVDGWKVLETALARMVQ